MALLYIEKYFTEKEAKIKKEREDLWKDEIKLLIPPTLLINKNIRDHIKNLQIQTIKKF